MHLLVFSKSVRHNKAKVSDLRLVERSLEVMGLSAYGVRLLTCVK